MLIKKNTLKENPTILNVFVIKNYIDLNLSFSHIIIHAD